MPKVRKNSNNYGIVGHTIKQYGSPIKISDNSAAQTVHPPTNLRTVVLIICTVFYLFAGAAVFDFLESNQEEQDREVIFNQRKLLEARVKEKHPEMTPHDFKELEDIYVKLIPHRAGYQWRFAGSLFFAITVITTIGYGHSTPWTIPGKLFCMAYAFVGIPLSLIVYQAVGDRLNYIIKISTNHIRRKLFGSHCLKGDKEHEAELHIVTACNWGLVGLVMFGGAGIFKYYEGWSYFDSFYYCFVTLSTIGFGDFVVLQKGRAIEQDPFYIMLCIMYIMVALCVVASALNLLVLKYLTMNTKYERQAAEANFTNSYTAFEPSQEPNNFRSRSVAHINGLV